MHKQWIPGHSFSNFTTWPGNEARLKEAGWKVWACNKLDLQSQELFINEAIIRGIVQTWSWKSESMFITQVPSSDFLLRFSIFCRCPSMPHLQQLSKQINRNR